MIYLNAEDIRNLLKGDDVAVPDTNIVLRMPDEEEMKSLGMSPYQIGLEKFERQDFDKSSVVSAERERIKNGVLALKSRRRLKYDYVQIEDVIKAIGG